MSWFFFIPISCALISASPTEDYSLTLKDTPTPSATAFDCGPPDGWVDYTAHQGDTLEALSAAYRVSIEELQHANCMGTSTAVTAGDIVYWKFKSYDGYGYVAVFPASGSFSFTSSLTCP